MERALTGIPFVRAMISESIHIDSLVVGAGVVGLAVASRLASSGTQVLVIEENPKFGMETSSRNSEVIHSGIHYPVNSEKTSLCIRGRTFLYHYLASHSVPHKKCGKLVVACTEAEIEYLEKLVSHCNLVGVAAERWTSDKISKEEAAISVKGAVYLPETGIVDSHQYMAALERETLNHGANIAYETSLDDIESAGKGWDVKLYNGAETVWITAGRVINCAGLAAANVSNLALGVEKYEHRFCRGRYFSLAGKFRNTFKHLVYPVPQKDGLGVHVTIDMGGAARLGPDVDWCEGVGYDDRESLYDVDWEGLRPSFLSAAKRYLPSLTPDSLSPGLVGIRPKLFIEGVARPDFLIENHGGFVHCLGVESPGLTASLAIAERVCELVL